MPGLAETLNPIWPIYPQPLDGESLESWIIRQACANCYSPQNFSTVYFRIGEYRYDFDFLSPDSETSERAACSVVGGRPRIMQMTLYQFQSKLPGITEQHYRVRRRFSWINNGSTIRRFCPLCFAEDAIPHLRLIWRLSFVLICPKHKVPLRSECSSCHAPFRPYSKNPHYDIRICAACGSRLAQRRARTVNSTDPRLTAVTCLVGLLDGTIAPADVNWSGDIKALFETLKILLRFVRNVRRSGSEPYTKFSTRDRSVLLEALGEAWQLLQDPDRLSSFIKKHQYVFNALTYSDCPDPLRKYRLLSRARVDWMLVRKTISRLYDDGDNVSLNKVADITGYSVTGLCSNRALARLAKRLNIRNRRKRMALVLKPILAKLVNEGTYPSCRAINNVKRVIRTNPQWEIARDIAEPAQIKFRAVKRRQELKLALKLKEVIDATPVSYPVNLKDLARHLGVTRCFLASRSSCLQPIQRALERSRRYWSSFSCQNRDCAEYHQRYTGHLKVRCRVGLLKLGHITSAILRCNVCMHRFSVKVQAPLHRDFARWEKRSRGHAAPQV